MSKSNRIIVWYRKDLRLHDNEALIEAVEQGHEVIPVFVFDKDIFLGDTFYGFQKMGRHRAKFLLESVAQLRQSFLDKGIDLVVRFGQSAEEVFELAKTVDADYVYANMERTHDEVIIQNALEKKLWSLGKELLFFRGKMLYYTQDLPFPIAHAPDTFKTFRKEVERLVKIRPPFDTPTSFQAWTATVDAGELPTLKDFGYVDFAPDERAPFIYTGGEAAALRRIKSYFGQETPLKKYKDSKKELAGRDNTSKLSPWLANGCLSPKYLYQQLEQYEQDFKANKSTKEFFQELLYRDYYRLMGKKYGDCMFEEGGIQGHETQKLEEDEVKFHQWINGQTEAPLINACMQQLKYTGYLSQKGRSLVASYLINDMGIHWRMGAAYFQHILIDYDICTNWINWNMVGGVGPDPKDDRSINIENQLDRLDPNRQYVNRWLEDSLQGV